MQQKIIKTGNSLCVTIPSGFVREFGIKAGDVVSVKVNSGKGMLTCTFPGTGQLSLLAKK